MMAKVISISVILSLFFDTFLVNYVTGEILPVEGDCTKYQLCDYSGCFVFPCAPGTEFNPKVLVCDYPLVDRGECGGGGARTSFPGSGNSQSPSGPPNYQSPMGGQSQQPGASYPQPGGGNTPMGSGYPSGHQAYPGNSVNPGC
ncbi:hypothetical protein QAD02_010665 [Eretmocerus hayati]|uniref:Uncharacterized protein n=1 Tax=Eretmocerus hayati TaxID=131215 RepID=A0ACC2NUV3_9HYME|nr:hypothetical protein QAD02_010665 [Eretmocerus hayati]